jgi:hypothetical protein
MIAGASDDRVVEPRPGDAIAAIASTKPRLIFHNGAPKNHKSKAIEIGETPGAWLQVPKKPCACLRSINARGDLVLGWPPKDLPPGLQGPFHF